MTDGRIDTAAQLWEALRSSDPQLRMALIGGLARDPAAGLRLGKHEGRDLIDMLILQIDLEPDLSALRIAMIRILAAFADDRVAQFLASGLVHWPEFDRVEVAARYVVRIDGGSALLVPMIWKMDRPHHAQAAARALLELPPVRAALAPRDELRATLLAGVDAPALVEETLVDWLDELAGPLKRRALHQASLQGAPAARLLLGAGAWPRLDGEAKKGMLAVAREHDAPSALPILDDALAQDDLLLPALRCLSKLGPEGDALRPPLSRFVGQPRAIVEAALGAARLDVDLRSFLAHEDIAIRCAALHRFADEETAHGPRRAALLDALVHPAWELRAVAAKLLVAEGRDVATDIRPLATHADEALRLAAAHVLIALGEPAPSS
jgi:hypothetical protein